MLRELEPRSGTTHLHSVFCIKSENPNLALGRAPSALPEHRSVTSRHPGILWLRAGGESPSWRAGGLVHVTTLKALALTSEDGGVLIYACRSRCINPPKELAPKAPPTQWVRTLSPSLLFNC